MLKVIFLFLLLPIVIIEIYRLINLQKFNNLLFFKKNYYNIVFNFLTVVLLYFFINFLNLKDNFNTYSFICYIIIIIFNFFLKRQNYNLYFFLLIMLINYVYIQNNLAYFILFTELLTLVLFFFLYLDFLKNNKNYKNSIIIFFINNFIVFLFSIGIIVYFYYFHGTTNLTILIVFLEYDENIKIFMYLFIFIKLKQCFMFLLNLKYYSISTPSNIFLYKLPYFIFI